MEEIDENMEEIDDYHKIYYALSKAVEISNYINKNKDLLTKEGLLANIKYIEIEFKPDEDFHSSKAFINLVQRFIKYKYGLVRSTVLEIKYIDEYGNIIEKPKRKMPITVGYRIKNEWEFKNEW